MKTMGTLVGVLLLSALSGCNGDENAADAASSGGSGGTSATGGAGGAGGAFGGTGGGAGSSAGTAGGGTGGSPNDDPFTVVNGVCRPRAMAGPEPIYEIDSIFGHVGSMAARGDTLYFAESAEFDDIPPRLAKLDGAGPPTTVVEGARATQLRVFGDKLYYVDIDTDELKSLDLTTTAATPVVLNTVAGVVDYDEQHVVYKDETNFYAIDVGVQDSTSAVTLHAAEGIYSQALSGDTLYLSSREGVYRVGLDGTEAMDVVPDDHFAFIGLIESDGTSLYFDDSDLLKVVPVGGGEPRSFAVAGPDALFDNGAAFSRLFPAGGLIYWADDGSSYGWTAVDGSRCGILGTHDGFFEGGGTLAASYFYASGEATIYRAARVE